MTPAYPSHVWGLDITYRRCQHGWHYRVAIIDGSSRYVVARELSGTPDLPFVLTAAKRALAVPTIWNHDPGRYFARHQNTAVLLAEEVQISLDSNGRALANVFTQRLACGGA